MFCYIFTWKFCVAIPAGHFLSNEIDGNALILIMELGNVGGSEINNVLFMVSTTLLLFFFWCALHGLMVFLVCYGPVPKILG